MKVHRITSYNVCYTKLLRSGNETICGGVILNPVIDPMKKNQKKRLLEALNKKDFVAAYNELLEAHKKGLGIISSTQRFALSHDEAINFARNMQNVFIDEKELVIYPVITSYSIHYTKLYELNKCCTCPF